MYTAKTALEYSKNGKLEEWIHQFLHNDGNNIGLSDGLKIVKRYFMAPVKMPLSIFERCCGPEEGLKYRIDEDGFNERVGKIKDRFETEWDMPPLIINYCKGKFELNDGNHRFEALKRAGAEEYYIIIWITDHEDYLEYKNRFGGYYG